MEKSERPWGTYEVIDEGIGYKVKIIKVNPGQKLSYQFHNFREEPYEEFDVDLKSVKQSHYFGYQILSPGQYQQEKAFSCRKEHDHFF